LIEDGDVLQIGVGSASEAVALNGILDNKSDLGMAFGDDAAGYYQTGQGRRDHRKNAKQCNTGKFIANCC